MNIHIYYGSLTVFTEKLPNNYDSIVDLAIRDDEKHRKLKLDDGRDDAGEELPYYENVVAFSDDYPALTESLIESFVRFYFPALTSTICICKILQTALQNILMNFHLRNIPQSDKTTKF